MSVVSFAVPSAALFLSVFQSGSWLRVSAILERGRRIRSGRRSEFRLSAFLAMTGRMVLSKATLNSSSTTFLVSSEARMALAATVL